MPYLRGRWPPQLCLSAASPFVEYSFCVIYLKHCDTQIEEWVWPYELEKHIWLCIVWLTVLDRRFLKCYVCNEVRSLCCALTPTLWPLCSVRVLIWSCHNIISVQHEDVKELLSSRARLWCECCLCHCIVCVEWEVVWYVFSNAML